MRTLRFIIDGLSLKRDPQCDFSGLVPGTKGFLQAEFRFDSEWSTCEKMAVFIEPKSNNRIPVRIVNNVCAIPDSILLRRRFKIKIIGVNRELRLPTNELEVKQDG